MRRIALLAIILFTAGCGQKERSGASPDLLLNLHNEERASIGLEPLKIDENLSEYASSHAEWMARKNSLQHSAVLNLLGRYRSVGENIAWNQSDEKGVFKAWMGSKPHKANILSPKFRLVGFGMCRNARGQPYWCSVFGN